MGIPEMMEDLARRIKEESDGPPRVVLINPFVWEYLHGDRTIGDVPEHLRDLALGLEACLGLE